jgi:hypothetical protein
MMMLLKRVCVIALAFVMICYFLPKPLLAQELQMTAHTLITEHPIESIFTPDEAIATTKDNKSNKLLWGLVGVALLGGIAAVAGSGGSSGGGGGGDTPPETGTIPVEW